MNRLALAALAAATFAAGALVGPVWREASAAVLPDADRAAINALFQKDASSERISLPVSKAELRAAINGIDDYLETNKVAMNTAIPQPARGALNAKTKAWLYVYVIKQRHATEVP